MLRKAAQKSNSSSANVKSVDHNRRMKNRQSKRFNRSWRATWNLAEDFKNPAHYIHRLKIMQSTFDSF